MPRRLIIAGARVLSIAALWGCERPRIEWSDPAPLTPSLAQAADLAFEGEKLVPKPPAATTVPVPAVGDQCQASVRVARDGTGDWYAVWWAVRQDSTADLVVSRSSDGKTWTRSVRVDSTDAGRTGCQRPAPSLVADAGNVHVAYAMTAREGPGIFAAHSMDRGTTFHTPVTIVYGERIGSSAVAARGNLVAVAYEDPNSDPRGVGVAVSRTMGHTYEPRAIVSPAIGDASSPRVALGSDRVAVTWTQGRVQASRGGEPVIEAGAPRMFRVGVLR